MARASVSGQPQGTQTACLARFLDEQSVVERLIARLECGPIQAAATTLSHHCGCSVLNTFAELVARRREWIDNVLKPWCRSAPLADLKRAAMEWEDLAGRIDAKATLWTWAWSRFPQLVHEQLAGVDETHELRVTLKSGETLVGYPDNRKTERGRLVLHLGANVSKGQPPESEPLSIDDIAGVERV